MGFPAHLRNFKKSLKIGTKITLPGYAGEFQITQLKPCIIAYIGMSSYRISPRMIKHAKIVEETAKQLEMAWSYAIVFDVTINQQKEKTR